MIQNQPSVETYMLRFGSLLLPQCSGGGEEWLITPFMSIFLRIVMIAWIVISVYIFLKLKKYKRFQATSEPVEYLSDENATAEEDGGDAESKKTPIQRKLKSIRNANGIMRWFKIVFMVTGVWVLALILFQGPLLRLVNTYVEDEKFYGRIDNFDVRISNDGVASISFLVDGKMMIVRSDRNIQSNTELLDSGVEHGRFYGLEAFDLEDPLIENCLEGSNVEVYAKNKGVYYTIDNNDKYFVRFDGNPPTCQENYVGACTIGGQKFIEGDVVYYDSEGYYCECHVDGISCLSSESAPVRIKDADCTYDGKGYLIGDAMNSKDNCSTCTCTVSGLSCVAKSCQIEQYDTTDIMEVPIHFWFVNESEPSDRLYLKVGAGDRYEVRSSNPFGQNPITDVILADGKAKLIISVAQVKYPESSPEVVEIPQAFGDGSFLRYYSVRSGKYMYSEGVAKNACQSLKEGATCLSPVVDDYQIECVAEDGYYHVCDKVLSSISFTEPK